MMRTALASFARASNRFNSLHYRTLCTNSNSGNKNPREPEGAAEGSLSKFDPYRELDNLNFTSAAKILFSDPPRKKKFGLDFHLVQLFFACLPSLAVYLVAQYARYEMRKMEAELEKKKQAEEEKEAIADHEKEKAVKAKEEEKGKELLEVKVRLGKLEETLKEIVVESKKNSSSSMHKKDEEAAEKKEDANVRPNGGQDPMPKDSSDKQNLK